MNPVVIIVVAEWIYSSILASLFSLSERSPGRAIVLPPASALAWAAASAAALAKC